MWFLPDVTKKPVTEEQQREINSKECFDFNVRQIKLLNGGVDSAMLLMAGLG